MAAAKSKGMSAAMVDRLTLTPARLARILKESGDPGGDFRDYLTLAEEMEEREPQYRMALAQRKLAIRNLSPVVEAASKSKRDKDIAAGVQRMLGTTAFRQKIANAIASGIISYFNWFDNQKAHSRKR